MDLNYFLENNFSKSLMLFFKDLNIPLNNNIEEKISPKDIFKETFNEKNETHNLIQEIYFAGQVNDSSFKVEDQKSETLSQLADKYDTMLIFGVVLNNFNVKKPSKTVLSEITRLLNKTFPNRPVVVIFKYGNYLAFANCERTDYKIEKIGTKVGKVSLLKDINIEDPHSGHLRILKNLTIQREGKGAVNSFEELYKHWQEVFDVSVLNKMNCLTGIFGLVLK